MSPPSVNSPIIKTPAYVRVSSKWLKESADEIINSFDEKTIPGKTLTGNQNARKSDVFLWDIWKINLTDLQKVIIFKLKEIFIEENKKYQFDLDYSSINVQYTKYQEGGYYTWHTDDDVNDTHKLHQNVRKLSITVALNVGSYEGGGFTISFKSSKRASNNEYRIWRCSSISKFYIAPNYSNY